eukprot:3562822-Pyramimonas_sp.AAC.1
MALKSERGCRPGRQGKARRALLLTGCSSELLTGAPLLEGQVDVEGSNDPPRHLFLGELLHRRLRSAWNPEVPGVT